MDVAVAFAVVETVAVAVAVASGGDIVVAILFVTAAAAKIVDIAAVFGIAFDAREVTAEVEFVVTVLYCWLLMLKSRSRLQKVCTKAGGSKAKIFRGGRCSYGPARASRLWTTLETYFAYLEGAKQRKTRSGLAGE